MTFMDTRPNSQKPIEERSERQGDDVIRRSHPAFGMIGASRVSCGGKGMSLFGSSIEHHGFITITIVEACEELRHGSSWHYGKNIIIKVSLSESQWATFVSSMNVGNGVPCTLNDVRDGKLIEIPEIIDESFQAKRQNEISRSVSKKVQELKAAVAYFDELLKKPSIKKSELQTLRKMFIHPSDYAESTAEYTAELLTKHNEKLVGEARAELDAYVTRMALQFPSITGVAPTLQIEDQS